MQPTAPTSSSAKEREVSSGAGRALLVLTGINMFNYMDRFVPSAVKDLFKADLHLTDAQTSLPLSAFVIVYMLACPLFATLADRWPRKQLIAAGVALWSLATGVAGLASSFGGFLFARALVGIGEAAYGTLSPALLSDYYPATRRNRILTGFYVAVPVGAALGFGLGGQLGQAMGWRAAFMLCGFPGLVLSGLTLFLREPPRESSPEAESSLPDWPQTLRVLGQNRPYILTVAGYVAATFAAGGMADWMTTYLTRLRGFDLAAAGRLIGLATVLGGLSGTILGGLCADRLRRYTRQPYFALSSISIAIGTVFTVVVMASSDRAVLMGGLFLAHFFLWFNTGPINATLVNVTSAKYRVRAFSLSILLIHLLGDAISPFIIGTIADVTGRLLAGLVVVPIGFGAAALIWAVAWRTLPDEAI